MMVRQTRFIDFSTSAFFDRDVVKNSMDRVTRRALMRAASDTRRFAKRSMKARPVGVAAMRGAPPFKHKHSARGKRSAQDYGLERSIMYAYDTMDESAVVGPSSVRGRNVHKIAERHEFGGRIVEKNKRRKLRRLGGSGELRFGKARTPNRAGDGQFRKRRNQGETMGARQATKYTRDTLVGDVWVTYGKLFTQEQARRANRINAQLYGPAIIHGKYPERKFMRPSLEEIAPKLPAYFENAVV